MQFQIPSSKISFGTFLDRGGFGTVYKGTYAKDSNSQSLEVRLSKAA